MSTVLSCYSSWNFSLIKQKKKLRSVWICMFSNVFILCFVSVAVAKWGDRQRIPGLWEHLQWVWDLHRWGHGGPRTTWDAWGCGDGQWHRGHAAWPWRWRKQVGEKFHLRLYTQCQLWPISLCFLDMNKSFALCLMLRRLLVTLNNFCNTSSVVIHEN